MRRLRDDGLTKQQLLERYLWPELGLSHGQDPLLTVAFATASQRYEVVSHEHFELPGPAASGYAYMFEHALSHNYYHFIDTGSEQGIRIHRPHQLILQGSSLLHGEDRQESLQALEPGGLLAIPYPALRLLMGQYPALAEAIRAIAKQQERQYQWMSQYLAMPVAERFKRFRQEHHAILHRLPQWVQAMHINVSRSHFQNLLKKFGGNG